MDTRLQIRPRSALGLKYISLTPGRSTQHLHGRRHDPARAVAQADRARRLLQHPERRVPDQPAHGVRGLRHRAGGPRPGHQRGDPRRCTPFLDHLQPVMTALSDPDTELRNLFREAGRTSAQIAPVASTYAPAVREHGHHLRGAVAPPRPPPGHDRAAAPDARRGHRQLPRAAAVPARHRAAVAARCARWPREIERSLPLVSDAFEVGHAGAGQGADALPQHRERVQLARRPRVEPQHAAGAAATCAARWRWPRRWWSTWRPTRRSATTGTTTGSAIGEHVSETVPGGTGQRSIPKSGNNTQDNRLSSTEGDRPVDVPVGPGPEDREGPAGRRAPGAAQRRLRERRSTPQGNADCEVGQRGYVTGPFVPDGRYPPSTDPAQGGGSHVVLGAAARQLGPDLQGARARHRQPEGRPLMARFSDIPRGSRQSDGMSPFKAGAIAVGADRAVHLLRLHASRTRSPARTS